MNAVVLPQECEAVVIHSERSVVITQPGGETVVVQQPEPATVVVTRGIPGPPGPPGDATGGALLVVNRLSEFDDETKKAAARTNLGLQVIDGGTFF
ncbi:hypothetical protein KW843_22650 [Acidovorax sp. sif1233]|uniref:hypothetical protein n=1 Tax=Acidovorax sp. sif1233 TaxID=2854792 RepID=UPI001C440275|nr:hypothetical protein [Acidovorax sp. sif1233]MBV7457298.1 hypothetical protein [Acidovorax sp. sif1233]